MFSLGFGLRAWIFLVFAGIFAYNGLPCLTLVACLLATLSTVAFVMPYRGRR